MENDFLKRLESAIEVATNMKFENIMGTNGTRSCVYPRMIFSQIASEHNIKPSEIRKLLQNDRAVIYYYLLRYPDYMHFPDFKRLDNEIRLQLGEKIIWNELPDFKSASIKNMKIAWMFETESKKWHLELLFPNKDNDKIIRELENDELAKKYVENKWNDFIQTLHW